MAARCRPPAKDEAILFFPAGARGPAFLVTQNFNVIKTYNISDVYALAVLTLADRLGGAAPLKARWPEDDRQLSREDRMKIQVELQKQGYKVSNTQGMIDFDLRDNIREMQSKFGMTPDGHPTAEFLGRLVKSGGRWALVSRSVPSFTSDCDYREAHRWVANGSGEQRCHLCPSSATKQVAAMCFRFESRPLWT